MQGGNTLDTALALCRIGATLAAADSLDTAREATASFDQLRTTLEPIEPSERTTASPPPDLASLSEQTSRDLARVRARADLKRLGAIATRLGRAEDAALTDVLTSLLYAIWLGDTQGQPFLAGNVARRHDYGVRLMTWRRPRRDTMADPDWRHRAMVNPGTCVGRSWVSMSAWLAWPCVVPDTIGPRISPRSTTATAAR